MGRQKEMLRSTTYSGRVALVTGGAQGIGRAVVEGLLEAGYSAAFLDVDADLGAVTAEETGALFLQGDAGDSVTVREALARIGGDFGRLDVLVNNAGINSYFDPVAMTEPEWEAFFRVDLKSAWICAKHSIPLMRRSGHGGSIINMSSIHAFTTASGSFPYAAAKAGLVGLTKSLALDLGPDGIRVNAVCPGYVRTRLLTEWFEKHSDSSEPEVRVNALHPLGRIGEPADVAAVVTFLAGDGAAFVNGTTVIVDGGLTASFPS